VADHYRRYPGESIIFYTRLRALEQLPGFTLRISFPQEASVEDYRPVGPYDHPLPDLEIGADTNYLAWRVADEVAAGTSYEYRTELKISPEMCRPVVESEATATVGSGKDRLTAAESVTVSVLKRGTYLKYLPALYHDDDFMARFLMLFESFWKPIESQIDSVSLYFDPQMTTPDMLPWLASWIGLMLDESWPEERRRQLLGSAASLYRKRGTKEGLRQYLEIYTGEKPTITEHRADNFRVGSGARLGPGIALGRGNKPHTFTVTLSLPPLEAADEADQVRKEGVRRRNIEAIIEAEKPAHTSYRLNLETEER
jgi:phage tail-like protein